MTIATTPPAAETFQAWRERMGDKITLDGIIAYLEMTRDDEWNMQYCRSKCGTKNCLMGHLFNLGGGDNGDGSALCSFFEEQYATSFMFYPINDGEDPRYPQTTPKQRILAYLCDLRDGKEKTTADLLSA